jgi:hypothetical protein
MDEDNEKRERELRLLQASLAKRLEEERAARAVPWDDTGDPQAEIAIHLPAEKEYSGATGFDSPLSG